MKKLLTLLLTATLAVACCFGFTACGKSDHVVALICLHGENSSYDKNFIDAFIAACEKKGLSEEQYAIVTEVPETGEDCYNRAVEFANDGYKAVFADSFGHDLIKAAKEYPEVQFCHATGTGTSKLLDEDTTNDVPANLHNAFASIYEGRYLAGVAAGLKILELYGKDGVVSDENAKIGYVGAHPYAEVISGFTSFYLGAKSIVENVTMEVKYTFSWYDELGEKSTAEALIKNGAKLVSGHADSNGVPAACKENNIPNVFYNGTTAEDTFVIASKINWQPYFEIMIDGALGKATIPVDYTGTIATGSVEITALGKAAAKGTQAKLDEVKAKLTSGELKVFDTSKFTVKNAKGDKGEFSKAEYITMDENGHLTAYKADVIDLGDYKGETNVVVNGVFEESTKRSAPYFDIIIDGITIGANAQA